MGNDRETAPSQVDGAVYLDLLGYSRFADMTISTSEAGGPVLAKDFLDVCGEHSAKSLEGLRLMRDKIGEDHPIYVKTRDMIIEKTRPYFDSLLQREQTKSPNGRS
jgi:hypothetical protein